MIPPLVPGGAVSYDLPAPPSTNALYANMPGKGRKKTETYRKWKAEAGWSLRAALAQPLDCKTPKSQWAMLVRLADRGTDADNLKALPDLFVSMGLVPDDKHMGELHVYRDHTIARGRCSVTLWALP